MSNHKPVGSKTQVRLEHPGYEPLNATISRDERVDPAALIGGFFLLVPFLWIMEYDPDHYYELRQAGGRAADQGAPAPAETQPERRNVAERARRAAELNASGRDLVRSGDIEGAVATFQKATQTFPDPHYFFNLCVALDAADRFPEAIDACEEVFDHDPSQRLEDKTRAVLERLHEK
jgi:tetratricopeptide (TPR) repeat protein